MQVRDLPEAVYRRLAERARQEHRSLAQQATVLLAQALDLEDEPRQRRRRVIETLAKNPISEDWTQLPAPEDLIREDRNR